MIGRGQSQVIGIVLLTAIVTVTVTGSGVVVLSEYQAQIGSDDPLVDIDSTYTEDELILEHTGGDAVNVSDVFVQIGSSEDRLSLAEFDAVDTRFAGGMTAQTEDIETRAGSVTVQVVHEPSETIIHSEEHYLGFLFLIGGESGPVFMTNSSPVNYTAPGSAELTIGNSSVVDINESANNVSGLTSSGSTTITADDQIERKTIDLTVVEPDVLGVDTLDVAADGGTITADGELTALGSLDETDLYIQYSQQGPVDFNGQPDNASDGILSDGPFVTTGPRRNGYAHDEGRVEHRSPLVPGVNRTYEYLMPSDIYSMEVFLTDDDGTEIGSGFSDDIPENSTFNMTVEYTDDGSMVNVSLPNKEFSIPVSSTEAVYLSTKENPNFGSTNTGSDSLRVITVPGPVDPQYKRIRSGVEEPTSYTGEISNLEPNTTYYVQAHTEREITNAVLNATDPGFAIETEGLVATRDATNITAESATLNADLINSYGATDVSIILTDSDGTVVADRQVGTDRSTPQSFETTVDELVPNTTYSYYTRAEDSGIAGGTATDTAPNVSFTTEQPVVDTLNTTSVDGDTLNVSGELVDLGGLDEIDIYIRYSQQGPIDFNGETDDAGDGILSDGPFVTTGPGPNGYAHNEGRVDHRSPLFPGVNRTYEYFMPSDIYSMEVFLTDDDGTEIGSGFSDDIPENSTFNMTVEYTDDGSTVNVYLPNTEFSIPVSSTEAVYLTTKENPNFGSTNTGSDSLRVITVPGPGPYQSKRVESDVGAPTTYSGTISDLYPETYYYVEAYAETSVNGQLINATDLGLANSTEGLVETRDPTDITPERATLRGNLTSSAGSSNVSFVLTESDGTVVTETQAATGLDTPQEFETTVDQLEPNTEYVYYARAADSGIAGGTATDNGTTVSFTTKQPVVETNDVTVTGSDSLDVDAELVDLGGLDTMDLYIRYAKRSPVDFNGQTDDAGDNILSDGSFVTTGPGPNGYSHEEGWIDDRAALVPGANRTYEYLSPSNIYSVEAEIRNEGGRVGYDYSFDIPAGTTYNMTVIYTDDGSTVNAYIEGEKELTFDASSADEVYFSTKENRGFGDSPGPDSLRLINATGPGSYQYEPVRSDVGSQTTFSTELSGLDSDAYYYVEGYAEQTVNDQLINGTDPGLVAKTDP